MPQRLHSQARTPPEDRDIVPKFDWGAADGRPEARGFFERHGLTPEILQAAASEAGVVSLPKQGLQHTASDVTSATLSSPPKLSC